MLLIFFYIILYDFLKQTYQTFKAVIFKDVSEGLILSYDLTI